MANNDAVRVHALNKVFGNHAVLNGLSLSIGQGEFVALLGRSGSGKSTFLRVLGALDGQVTGQIRVPARRAIVFQEPRLFPWQRVMRNVTVGLPQTRSTREQALGALSEVGLDRHAQAWPRTLSGGEAQRAALARALVRDPQLLLLDEPFGALDALTRLRMHVLLRNLYERHRPAVLLVTHDVDEAILLADRVLVLTDGRISFDEPVSIDDPVRRNSPRFDALRASLLQELGIVQQA
ncbi:sulfonate ABC transporter ATP-binding protein [Advenella kashmirensis W13003]|uniref:Sulfonate ABC transporter ATP-binding protein n=1 Tax=Advenella kashmirensis W13003 TaxID=1424334 RepID=V8QU73_9BURK|nr:ABC transporter ATP-binding protein [Advenella kashmirensis]ETF02903.1 sulfonate ABC transporter ATP-binding protein [Advenella kashmirensis W13003]